MTIKSFFHYTSFFLICLILVAALALIMTSRELNDIATQNQLATEIVRGIFELNLLTSDYLIRHGQRVQRQWFARHSSLGSLLKRAHFSGSGTGETMIVMTDDHQDLKSLFEELMKTVAEQAGGTDEAATTRLKEWQERIIGQISVKSQSMVDSAFQLQRVMLKRAKTIQHMNLFTVLGSFIFIGAMMVLYSRLIIRKVVEPIEVLHEGTRIIAKGDLDFKVEIESENELGELGRSFNDMTTNLKQVTASRDELDREVQERKRVEAALRKSEAAIRHQWEQFLAILENFPEALYVVDPATYEVIFVNRHFTDVLGDNPVGKKCYRAFQGLDDPCPFCTNDIIQKNGAPYHWEHHNKLLDVHYFITDQIIRWPDGRNVRFEAAIDITQRKKAEEKMQELMEELGRSNRELEQFAYIASHDLQEPLRAIAGFLRLLEKRYYEKVDDEGKMFIDRSVAASSRMKNLIQSLLAYSRVHTRAKEFEQVLGEKLLESALANLQVAVNESQAVVTHDPIPELEADPSQITQLFQNLIGNGIKFRGERTPEVHVGVKQHDGEWLFSVRDNGIGIEEQYFERIFRIFQRLHSRREYSGTGIGLSLCRRIVERHEGRIWIESIPGEGTTFFFTLPAKDNASTGVEQGA